MSKNVAIIGAGASGIISAKVLMDHGFNVTVFEALKEFGGVWNYSDISSQGSLYKSLRTNLPKEAMIYLQSNVQYKSDQSFVSHDVVKQYLHDNAEAWDIEKYTHFNTQVISLEVGDSDIERLPLSSKYTPTKKYIDTVNNKRWKLSYKISDGAHFRQEIFDYVVICNGHFSDPDYPKLEGADKTKIKISHSQSYRKPGAFKGRVLCVGYASSGVDIAHELTVSGCEVYVAKRGVSLHEELTTLSAGVDKNVVGCRGFVSSPVRYLGEQCIETENGQHIEFDHLLWCTGYSYCYPFLQKGIISTANKTVHPLWQQLLHVSYPSLAFVGLPWKILPFPFFETQAEVLAGIWSNHEVLPKLDDRISELYSHYDEVLNGLNLPAHYMHHLGDAQWNYQKSLLKRVGKLSLIKQKQLEQLQKNFNLAGEARAKNPFTYRDGQYPFINVM